ncbi:hypothetical protein KGQ20_16965 [Catenulispora sp. NF23]|uniref:Sel1 repeat family protein n=1 Tax=Catenulispora pinistramenti TaxID=2705254 RepID=A0ABS5KWH7_9ACTN|nr:hypothetical protein [Catenulispora pinistramenti]MBS2534465.1 hypothetical protein [Catenulispora pinistramenti]MBS2550431.1 hypothetical protein [Catenulispora pinistramenti]
MRAPLDALAAREPETEIEAQSDDAEETSEIGDEDEDPPEEPFIPLGSQDAPDSPPDEPIGGHAAIARSLSPPANIPRVLRKEARAFFDGAMFAYTEGDLLGARLSFLAVTAIGDPDTAPAAMVFLGVIAVRRRDVPEARMWFTRAATGPDQHWALVAANELRRLS